MGFYGKLTGTTRLNFQFDRIFPNRRTMDIGAQKDSVAVGRIVLVEYSSSPFEDYAENYYASNCIAKGSAGFRVYTSLSSQQVFTGKSYKTAKIAETGYFNTSSRPAGFSFSVGNYVEAIKDTANLWSDNIYVIKVLNTEGNFTFVAPGSSEAAALNLADLGQAMLIGDVERKTGNYQVDLVAYPVERQYNTNYNPEKDTLYSNSESWSLTQKELYLAELGEGKLNSTVENKYFIVKPQNAVYSNTGIYYMTWISENEDNAEVVPVSNKTNDAYYLNYSADKEHYRDSFDGKGYDSTVWQKVYVGGAFKYVNIAELNSVVPTFGLVSDAPSVVPVAPHFDKSTSTNLYYDVHWAPSWGVRVKSSVGDLTTNQIIDGTYDNAAEVVEASSDTEQYKSDTVTEWHSIAYDANGNKTEYIYCRKDANSPYRWEKASVVKAAAESNTIADYDTKIPAAIYWNSAGFDPVIGEEDTSTKNSISFKPTGVSGQQYLTHEKGSYASAPDTYEFSMQLPEIGNTISRVWDVVYGAKGEEADSIRNTNVSWVNASAVDGTERPSLFDEDGALEKNGANTIAGAIRTAQDIIGMVIEEYEGATFNEGTNYKALNPDWIYYNKTKNAYYRKVRKTTLERIQNPNNSGHYSFDNGYYYKINLANDSDWTAVSSGLKIAYLKGDGQNKLKNVEGTKFDSGLYYCNAGGSQISIKNNISLVDFYESANRNSSVKYFYEPNKYYKKDTNGAFVLLTDESKPAELTSCYACYPIVVERDAANIYQPGTRWDIRNEVVPNAVTLAKVVYDGYGLTKIEDFAQDIGTLNGLVKKMNDIIEGTDEVPEGSSQTVSGLKNQIKDIAAKFGNLQVNTLAAINNYGQLDSVTVQGDNWINTIVNNKYLSTQSITAGNDVSSTTGVTTGTNNTVTSYQTPETLAISHAKVDGAVPADGNYSPVTGIEQAVTLYIDSAGHTKLAYGSTVTNSGVTSSIVVPTLGSIKDGIGGDNKWIETKTTANKAVYIEHKGIDTNAIEKAQALDGGYLKIDRTGHVRIESLNNSGVNNTATEKAIKIPTTLSRNDVVNMIGVATTDQSGLLSAADKAKLSKATTTADGLMSAADKVKLDGIENATTLKSGLMSSTDKTKLDSIGNVTTQKNGLMTATDKQKLDGAKSFSTVEIAGQTGSSFAADGLNKTFKLKAGNNIQLSHTEQGELEITSSAEVNINIGTAGSSIKPIYTDNSGRPIPIDHTIESSVPANAVFTDTTYSVATHEEDGLIRAADQAKLDGIEANANNYSLPNASKTVVGGVKIGDNITLGTGGLISVPLSSTGSKGVVQVGKNIDILSGVISIKTGSKEQLGVLKVGDNISVSNDGVISLNEEGAHEALKNIMLVSEDIYTDSSKQSKLSVTLDNFKYYI